MAGFGNVGGIVQGAALGNAVAGPGGAAYGATQGDGGRSLDRKINPFNTAKSNEINKKGQTLADQQYAEAMGVSQRLGDADKQYMGAYDSSSKDYSKARDAAIQSWVKDNDRLKQQAGQQATDARLTYSNDIQPQLKNSMERAVAESQNAMSLKDAADPNNSVQKSVRALYDQQGKAARTQGLQDFGALSALGAQAAGQQFGGPTTAGAMGQIYAANQSQAGNAYASAQKRMQDLQQQGLDRGFDQSNQIYQYGQGALDRAQQTTGNYFNAEGDMANRNRAARDEVSGYSGDRLGVLGSQASDNFNMSKDRAGIDIASAYGGGDRQLAAMGQKYGYGQQGITNQLNSEESAREGKFKTFGGITQGLGAYLGAG